MAIQKYTKVAGKNVSGNSMVFFCEAGDISEITIANDEVSQITMLTGKTFQFFEADLDTIKFSSEGKGKNSFSESYKLELKASKKTTLLKSAIDNLANAIYTGVVVIRLDNNGKAWLSGYNPSTPERHYNEIATTYDSGASITDDSNAVTITLSGVGLDTELPLTDALSTQIKNKTATFITF